MEIRNIKITARGWPWQYTTSFWFHERNKSVLQKWGWNPFAAKKVGRFGGGGRAFELGVTASRDLRDIVLCLGIGEIRINIKKTVGK